MPNAIHSDAQPQDLIAAAPAPEEQNATSADTPAIDAAAAEERPLSPRELAMQRLSEGRHKQLAADGVTMDAAPAPANEPDAEANDVDAQLAAQTAPEVIADGFDKVRVRAKIDGEEVEVPLEQMVRQYQKHSTADRRLAEATRLLREAEARAVVQPAAPATEGQSPAAPAQAPTTKEFLSALFSGDEETAEAALDRLMQGRQPQGSPIPDAQQIAAQVKQQIEVESALTGFAKDFADVVSDPYLADMADRKLAERLEAGEEFADALKAAGNDVRGWLTSKTGAAPAATASTTRNERLERKATLDPVRAAHVTAASAVQQPRSEEQIRADALTSLMRSRPGMSA